MDRSDTDDVTETAGTGPETLGEVAASTGGRVDLSRIVGNIPVVLVFLRDLDDPASREVVHSLGEHLVEFGRDRVQVLAVGPVDAPGARAAGGGVEGNVRILADADGSIAAAVGAEYRAVDPTTVLIGADGEVAAQWVDTPSATFADELRARVAELTA